MKTRSIILLAMAALTVGCSTIRFTNGKGNSPRGSTSEQWHHNAVWALVEVSNPVVLDQECGGKDWHTVTTQESFVNGLAGSIDDFFLFGLDVWTPHTVMYSCADGPAVAANSLAPAPSAPLASVASASGTSRLVFWDLTVDPNVAQLKSREGLLSQAMFSELSNNKTLLVIDQGSRDAKLAQWKVEDCKKDDCRLETAKALFEADLMLIAKVDSIGNQCTLSMQIREVKTGQVKSSQFEAVACDPIAVLSALKASSAKLWPVSQ